MSSFRLQRGQFLVAGIVLIVVVALMIATLGYLYVSGESAGALHGQSERAYFAARSGVEYSSGQYFNGSACSSLNNANVPVGGAAVTFTLTPTLYAPLTLTGTTAALTAATTTVPVTSTAGYAPYGRILIDSELINYTSMTGTNFNGLTRGVGGTTAAAHASGVTVSQNLCIVSSTGTAGNAKRIVEGALGAGAMASPGAMGTMGADALVVYAKGTALTGGGFDRNVYYRLWASSVNDWGAEQTAQLVSANSSPAFIVVRFARTRNEAIMGVLVVAVQHAPDRFVPGARESYDDEGRAGVRADLLGGLLCAPVIHRAGPKSVVNIPVKTAARKRSAFCIHHHRVGTHRAHCARARRRSRAERPLDDALGVAGSAP